MRKRFNGKQIIALALAVTMVVSEVGVVQATSATEQVVEVASEEVTEQSQAPEITSEEVTEQSQALDITSEEVVVQEASVEVPAETVTSLTVPGKVTNLRFDDEDNDGIIDTSYLSWNEIQEADGYQIRVVGADGIEYADGTRNNSTELYYSNRSTYWYGASYDLDNLPNLSYDGYKLEDGKYTRASIKNEDGKTDYYEIEEGGTYSVYIRAYNQDDNGELQTVYGEWSDPVSYTIPVTTKLEKITDIRIQENMDESTKLYFNLGANDAAQLEIIDAEGKEYLSSAYTNTKEDGTKEIVKTYVTSSGSYNLDSLDGPYQYDGATRVKDAEGNYIRAFRPGMTYTLRVRGVVYGDTTAENQYTEWSEPLTYTRVELPSPEKPENLQYSSSSTYMSWNAVQYAEGYEIELKDAHGNWFNSYSSKWDSSLGDYVYTLANITRSYTYLYLDNYSAKQLNEDATELIYVKDAAGNTLYAGQEGETYTVRVRSYNIKSDGKRQYSDWSDTLTIAPPKEEEEANVSVAPVKVEGVRVSESGYVSWNAEQNAEDTEETTYYEVEVKDAAGREYYDDYEEVNDATGKLTSYKFVCLNTSATDIWADKLYTYTMVDGVPQAVIHPETGNKVLSFESGQTYTVRVRARRNMKNATGVMEPVYGDWSDAVSCTVPVGTTSTGVNAKPAQVTGVWIQTEPDEDSTLTSGPVMRWNSIENVDRYEFEIKDSKGNLYSYSPNDINGTYVTNYLSTSSTNRNPSINMDNLSGYSSYIKVDGSALTTVKNADGTTTKTFQAGETYTIRVRAINRYREYDVAAQTYKAAVEYQGDWSAPVTYSTSKKPSDVTGLAFVKADEDYYYFTYNADVADSTLYYQVATDNQFTLGSVVYDWSSCGSGTSTYKLRISKDASYLKPSTTYYVRVVNSVYGAPSKSMEKSKYNEILATSKGVVSFTTDAKNVLTPKNITNLKLYRETEGQYQLRFDAVLEENDHYEIQLATDASKKTWVTLDYDTLYVDKDDLAAGTNYVRVVAYVWHQDETTGVSKKAYGTPSNDITLISEDAMTAIGTLKLVESDNSYFGFTYSGNLRLDEDIQYWYSDSKNFDTNNKTVSTSVVTTGANVNKKISINKYNMKPGKTYYVKARTVNANPTSAADKYSAFSNVVKVKTTIPKVYVEAASVTKNSIKLSMGTLYESGWVKGYEIQKKSVKNKKTTWTTINKSSASTYTDKKLKADKTYTYRVRPYYFDEETNEMVNGTWTYYEAMTGWSGSLKLQAKAASKNSIKLSWSKISGAQGYEIYRYVTFSDATQISNGESNTYYKYKMVAKVSSKKKTYTDKKLTSGMSYVYAVKAYKTVGGKKVYIEDSAWASLDFELVEISEVQKSNGKVTVNWNPVYSAKGYLIEKQDPGTGKWSTYKKITKAKTSSYTFPATKDKENGDYYRIRAYKGTEYTNSITVSVDPIIAAPTKVKATTIKNGIKVSWKAVSGADYYRVYRTTSAKTVYNKDMKAYSYTGGVEVGRYIEDSTTISGYRKRTLEEMNVTSVVDQKIVYSYNGIDNQTYYAGPDTGVKYYYYVIAYKNCPQNQYVMDNDKAYTKKEYYQSGRSKAASATIKETKPAKTSISKTSSKSKSVTLTFKASKDADGYEIARSTKKNKGYKVIGTVNDPTKLTYKDKYNKKTNKLKKGKSYYYKVRAFKYNDDGSKVYSSYSSPKKVKVK